MGDLLLSASPSRAGTYTWVTKDANGNITAQSPTFTGGTVSVTTSLQVIGPQPSAPAFSTSGGHYTGGGTCFAGSTPPNNGPGSVKVNSPATPIVATFTWQATSSTDLPPPAVIVEQDCTAKWAQDTVTNDGSATGTIDCGLPGASVSSTTDSNGKVTGMTSSGTQYSSVPSPGTSFPVPAQSGGDYKPSATFSANAGTKGAASGGASIDYQVQAFPVTVDLQGVTSISASYEVLTGQQVTATLNLHGAPLSLNISAAPAVPPVVWTVGGSTFKSYPWTQPVCHVVPLADSDKQGTSVSFYTRKDKDPITVHFEGNLKVPAGASPQPTLHLAVDADPLMSVKPVVTNWTIVPSSVYSQGSGSGTTFGLFGIPGDPNALQGETWSKVKITVPAGFSGGTACFAQTRGATRMLYRKLIATAPSNAPAFYHEYRNGDSGLDSSYPYKFITDGSLTWSVASVNPIAGDSPAQAVSIADQDQGGTQWYSSTASDTFDTYLMYQPPSNNNAPTTYVPLQHYQWKWSGRMDLLNSDLNVDLVNGVWTFVTRYPSPSVSTDTPITLPRTDTDNHPEWDFIRPSPFLLQP